MKYQHIMLDTETLGREADAVVLSIAMVKFNFGSCVSVETDSGMQVFPEVQRQMKDRSVSWATIQWWMEQSEDARCAIIQPCRIPMEWALVNVRSYIDSKEYKVWANGAAFDPPLIRHLFNQYGIEEPWDFRRILDMRTMKWLSKFDSKGVPQRDNAVKHDALSDCFWQIDVLNAEFNKIKGTPLEFK